MGRPKGSKNKVKKVVKEEPVFVKTGGCCQDNSNNSCCGGSCESTSTCDCGGK